MYSTGNYVHYLEIMYNEKEYIYIHICIYMNHFTISQKLIQHCKSTTIKKEIKFSSVAQLCPTLRDPHGLQHASPPCPSPSPGACSNSRPMRWWCHPTILSSFVPFRTSTCFWLVSKEAESEMRILVSNLLREGSQETLVGEEGEQGLSRGKNKSFRRYFRKVSVTAWSCQELWSMNHTRGCYTLKSVKQCFQASETVWDGMPIR